MTKVVSLASSGKPIEEISAETNSEIIECLENCLDRARSGNLVALAVAYVDINLCPTTYYNLYKGRLCLLGAVSQLHYNLDKALSEEND